MLQKPHPRSLRGRFHQPAPPNLPARRAPWGLCCRRPGWWSGTGGAAPAACGERAPEGAGLPGALGGAALGRDRGPRSPVAAEAAGLLEAAGQAGAGAVPVAGAGAGASRGRRARHGNGNGPSAARCRVTGRGERAAIAPRSCPAPGEGGRAGPGPAGSGKCRLDLPPPSVSPPPPPSVPPALRPPGTEHGGAAAPAGR